MKARITQARVTFGFDSKPEVVMTKQWIGIDVSKKRLDIYIRPTGEAFSCDNTPAEIAQLVERLKTKNPTLVVLEATGKLHKILFL
ncbi:MAG: hypothetical protein V7L11_22370 [Nostoc sp.]